MYIYPHNIKLFSWFVAKMLVYLLKFSWRPRNEPEARCQGQGPSHGYKQLQRFRDTFLKSEAC